jgi:arylsulfatase A-like enzyme/lipopolysaccharide biosynthesis regulator YciM
MIGLSTFWLKRERPTVRPHNIVLISIDTIRADHLSCYGYKQQTSPNIDALAREAVLFEYCFANVPLTLPSHASMFSGLIPPVHGVRANGGMALSKTVVTLPELLRDSGYKTYGSVSAAVLDKQYGLNQGFDVYHDGFYETPGLACAVERRADETTAHALAWLEKNQHEKKFMFVHFFDPHFVYQPPPPYDKAFEHPYDGEIAFVDHCVGQIISKLKSLDLYEDTLLVLTGDHAELLEEHGEAYHGYYIYQNVLRVPLVVKPAGRSKSRTIRDNTSVIDVMPTILSQCGIAVPSPIQGIDLSGYLNGKDHQISDRFLYHESLTPTQFGASGLLGVIHDKWHYIQTTRPELYDRLADPQELNDRVTRESKRARLMKDVLRETLQEAEQRNHSLTTTLADPQAKTLESLGYVGGTVKPVFTFDQTKPDPKDIFKYFDVWAHSNPAVFTAPEHFERAIVSLRKVIEEKPDFINAYDRLAKVYEANGEPANALDILEKGVSRFPDRSELLEPLAEAYQSAGKRAKAIDIVKRILEHKPEDTGSYCKLGDLYRESDDIARALTYYRKALALDPEILPARINAALICRNRGYLKEAVEHFEIALRQSPDFPHHHNSVAWIQLTQRDADLYNPASALAHAEQAVSLSRDKQSASHNAYPYFLDTLSAALAANDRFDEAIETASRTLQLCRQRQLAPLAKQVQKHLNLYRQGKTVDPQ